MPYPQKPQGRSWLCTLRIVDPVSNKNIRTSEAAPVKSGRSPARATRGGLFTRRPEKVFCTTANGDGRRELAEKVRKIVCEEWERAGGSFEGAVVYQLLSL